MEQTEKPDQKSRLSSADYERIGIAMEQVVTSGYSKKSRLIIANFFRGLFFGLGTTIGVSIVLALLVYVLTVFRDLPFIGNIFERVEQRLEEARLN